jgi:hypothetical protein
VDLSKLELFKKLLNRIHVRIKTTAKHNVHEKFCWFVVPEIIIGVPKYDQAGCIAYLISKLQTNGFNVRYIHPNLLFISWNHWVPSYVRTEIKKKTGITLNEYGKKVEENGDGDGDVKAIEPSNPNDYMLRDQNMEQKGGKGPKKEYTPIKSYKPSGNLIYDDELLNKIEDRFL